MRTNNREILIYYNPDSVSDRKMVAHAQGMSTYIKTYSHAKSPSTGTSWQMILRSLDVHPKDLLNKAHPYYQENIRGREFNEEDWLTVLANNPDLIKAPIAVRGRRAILCSSPTDIYKLTAPSAPSV